MTPEVGAALPVLERTFALADMVAYGGATWDWHRLHYDRDYVAERGLPRPVVDGQVFGALLAAQVLGWAPPGTWLTVVDFRLSAMVFAGETVRCSATVRSVEEVGGATEVTVDADVRCGDRAAVSRATIVARLR